MTHKDTWGRRQISRELGSVGDGVTVNCPQPQWQWQLRLQFTYVLLSFESYSETLACGSGMHLSLITLNTSTVRLSQTPGGKKERECRKKMCFGNNSASDKLRHALFSFGIKILLYLKRFALERCKFHLCAWLTRFNSRVIFQASQCITSNHFWLKVKCENTSIQTSMTNERIEEKKKAI